MKVRRFFLLTFSLIFLFAIWQWPDGKLHIVFCDVGQGDASLVVKGSFQALIDTGPMRGNVVECLSGHMPFWDKELELLINSHPEADHLGDLADVAEHFRIGMFVVDGKMPAGTLAETIKVMVSAGTKLVGAQGGDRLLYGDLYFDILWPEEKSDDLLAWVDGSERAVLGKETGLNRYSLVMKMRYGETSVLFTGDIGEGEEQELVTSGRLGKVDVLKGAHHGSKFSSSTEFLSTVKPWLTVFSVGKNSYGHPTEEAMGRVAEAGSKIWRTDRQGELELVSDGRGWKIK
jgi:competence protein ComEC